MNQPVRDGKFEFVVTNVENAGDVVKVSLKVTNIGNEAQMFSSSSQKLLIGGKQYDSDLFESSGKTLETLNPGLGGDAVVGFKVPPGSLPDAIELHDSPFSSGVTVKL